jgi:hypothetical protein
LLALRLPTAAIGLDEVSNLGQYAPAHPRDFSGRAGLPCLGRPGAQLASSSSS